MKTLERKYEYTIKQYQRQGFGHSYYFVDAYLGNRLEDSIMIERPLSDTELERFFNVFLERYHKGENVEFLDSTETKMNRLFSKNKYNISSLEERLSTKMGADKFKLHYESRCYYLMWPAKDSDFENQETFHISKHYSPLMCLKMAYQMGETMGVKYRILLSDHLTEVAPELLAFAINEN